MRKYIIKRRRQIRDHYKATRNQIRGEAVRICRKDSEDLWIYLVNTALDRYGWWSPELEIDHIIPLCEAKSYQQVDKLCHWVNLQLLTREDNNIKGNSWTYR
jgi:hypothetical protein